MRRTWLAVIGVLILLCACQGPAAAPVTVLSMGHTFRATKAAVISSPLVADLDGDGLMEIAVGSWDGYFYLLDERLNTLPGWPQYSRRGFFGSPALTDLDGDAQLELLAAADAGQLYAWKKDGSSVAGWPVSLGYRSWASPAILPDGRVAIAGLRKLMVFERDGSPAPGWPRVAPEWSDATVAIGPDLLAVTTLTIGRPVGGTLSAWHAEIGRAHV